MQQGIDGTRFAPYLQAMKKTVLLFFLIQLGSGQFSNVDLGYLWPMKIKAELTSKFCDYRAGHFHGGLDIRTQGRTGLRVYAVESGHIYRVVTSFKGYGKAIYLRLHDNRIVVYGHLKRFADIVENRVFSAQMKSRRYYQDLYFTPTEFRVKNGELIGYSGETGAGAPHLHFEIRSPDNNPINPLLTGLHVGDSRPPEIHRLALKYFKPGYLPDGSIENYELTELLTPARQAEGEYIIKDTVVSDGQIALAVSGGDKIADQGYLYGFYGLKLAVDDSLLFEMRSDSLSYASTRQLNYVRDFELIRLYKDVEKHDNDANIFYRLYVPSLSRQYFWPGYHFNSGIVEAAPEAGAVRKVTVLAFDEAGNETGLIMYVRQPELEFSSEGYRECYRDGDIIYFIFQSAIRPEWTILQYRNSPLEPFKTLKSSLSLGSILDGGQYSYADTVTAAISNSPRTYRLRWCDDSGRTSPWLYFHETDSAEQRLTVWGTPDLLKLEYYTNDSPTRLMAHFRNVSSDFYENLRMVGPRLYRCDLMDRSMAGRLWIGIEDNGEILYDSILTLFPIMPKMGGIAQSPDSTLTIVFEPSSAYNQTYIFSSNYRKQKTNAGPAFIFELKPEYLLVDTPIKFIFEINKLELNSGKFGVYGESDGKHDWTFISKIDADNVEAEGLGLGKIALFEDAQPPTINSISPAKATSSRTPLLSCRISDDLSGLSLDNGLSMSIDDQWVPAEFDIDSGAFAYRVKNPLKLGRHKLEIRAVDNQGNSITRTSYFSITVKRS
jgi:hypothetical protein